jgi:hypothetical protein
VNRFTAPLPRPRLVFEYQAFLDLRALAALQGNNEINGYGWITRENPGTYLCTEIVFLDQEVTSGHARTAYGELGAYINGAIRQGRNPAGLRLQWHSHGGGPAYVSPTDEAYINGERAEYLVTLVVNAEGDWYCRLDLYNPRLAVEMPIEVRLRFNPERVDELRTQVQGQVMLPSRRLIGKDRLVSSPADGPVPDYLDLPVPLVLAHLPGRI